MTELISKDTCDRSEMTHVGLHIVL